MRKNQTSMTAIGIAILRGIESEKPAGERLCTDVQDADHEFLRANLPHRPECRPHRRLRVCDRLGGR